MNINIIIIIIKPGLSLNKVDLGWLRLTMVTIIQCGSYNDWGWLWVLLAIVNKELAFEHGQLLMIYSIIIIIIIIIIT